jgi:signal transduction histidine kinase
LFDPNLLKLINKVHHLDDRASSARELALYVGSEDLIVFVEDPLLNNLLPSAGFPQTLPEGKRWQIFLESLQQESIKIEELKSPFTKHSETCKGFSITSKVAVVFIKCPKEFELTLQLRLLFELLGAAFHGEMALSVSQEQNLRIRDSAIKFKNLAKSLENTKRDLQGTLRLRDEFLSLASHELKTPLTSLMLQSQIRKRKINKGLFNPTNEAYALMIDDDLKQFSRLSHLVDDMLDISRIRSGKLEIKKEMHNLVEAISTVIKRMQNELNEANVKITFSTTQNIELKFDLYKIEQVLTNLLSNALKYGGGTDVNVSIKTDENYANILVTDNGIGITKEDQQRIFAKFERAVDFNEATGLGLGLFICKEIIDAHSGTIEVQSEIGKGSTFIVSLPLS